MSLLSAAYDGRVLELRLRIHPGWAIFPVSHASGIIVSVDAPASITGLVDVPPLQGFRITSSRDPGHEIIEAYKDDVVFRAAVELGGAASLVGSVDVTAFDYVKCLPPVLLKFHAATSTAAIPAEETRPTRPSRR